MDPSLPSHPPQPSSSVPSSSGSSIPLQPPILQHPVLNLPVAAQHAPVSMVVDTSVQPAPPSVRDVAGSLPAGAAQSNGIAPEIQLTAATPSTTTETHLAPVLPVCPPHKRRRAHSDPTDAIQSLPKPPVPATAEPLEIARIKLSVPGTTGLSSPSDDLTPEPSSDGDAEGSEVDVGGGYSGGGLVTQTASRASASGESEVLSESEDGDANGADDEEYSADNDDLDDVDDPIDEDDDDEEDGTFGEKAKKKAKPRLLLSNGDRSSNGSAPKKVKKPTAAFPMARQRSASSDEDYAAKSHKKKSFALKVKGSLPMSRLGTDEALDSDGNLRRGAAKKVMSYNEAEVDYGLDSEDDQYEVGAAQGSSEAAGPQEDEIDMVLGYSRDEEHLGDPKDLPQHNLRFHIKWKTYSHIHNTDELYTFLKAYKGFKKVENFITKVFNVDQAYRNPDPKAAWQPTREDREAFEIDKEREKEVMESWKTIERVLDEREATNDAGARETEFYIKWNNLQYADSTWENYSSVSPLPTLKPALDDFHERQRLTTTPARSIVYPVNGRPAYRKIDDDPEYLKETGGQLKPFQLTGLNWLTYLWSKGENGVLADEMGLGKTVQSVTFLSYLHHTLHQYGPHLVVVPLSTIPAWQAQFKYWAPDLNVICYMGSAKSRAVIRETEFGPLRNLKFNVLLTTYEFILKDRAELAMIKWGCLEVDEAHRLKNNESQLYEALQSFSTSSRLLITGTPLQNNVKELLALMHFLMPDRFQLASDFDLNDPNQEAKIADLHEKLSTLMLRRLKKDVIKELPTKSEKILRVEMSGMQTHYYKNILTKNFAVLSKGGTQQVSLMNVAMELKKASNHPYLFDGAEPLATSAPDILRGLVMNSGKMVLLDKLLARLKADGHRVLIFSQMVRLLDIMGDYMGGRGYVYQRLDGTVPSEVRKKSIEHFNAPGSPDFAFLLSTRAGGLGINLETADTVIIFDSDYNPQNDLQAMARAHRIGQQRHVSIYRFVTKGTIEEDILERAKRKMILEYAIINQMDTTGSHLSNGTSTPKDKPAGDFSKDELAAILKFGASNIYKSDANQQTEQLEKMDLDDILTKADSFDTETAAPGGTSLGGEGFLSSFANIQDVKNDMDGISWDDIVPVEERVKFDEEESKRLAAEEEELTKRKRTAARKSGAYEGMDIDENGDDASGGEGKKDDGKKKVIVRKTNQQKAHELKERDLRVLIRGIQKWGDILLRYDEIVKEARLEAKNRIIIIQTCNEIITAAEAEIAAYKEHIRELQERGEPISSSLRQKAILFQYKSVGGLNAETIVARFYELKALMKHFEHIADLESYQIPAGQLKPTANWSVEWGAKEDAHLLIGIWKYGFGGWEHMMADESLELADKIFLDDPKTAKADPSAPKPVPGPIHLVRRGDYLCNLVREYEENRLMIIEQNRIIEQMPKKEGYGLDRPPLPSSSSSKSKVKEKEEKPRKSDETGSSKSKKDKKRHKTPEYTDSEEESYSSMDEAEIKELLRPVKKDLKRLKSGTDNLSREEKITALKECLASIGSRIDDLIVEQGIKSNEDERRFRKHCWVFASYFWPREGVNYSKLMDIHRKLIDTPPGPSGPKPKKGKRKSNANGDDGEVERAAKKVKTEMGEELKEESDDL